MEVAREVTQPFCEASNVSYPCNRIHSAMPFLSSIAQKVFRGAAVDREGRLTWPSRVPLRMSCSAIFRYLVGGGREAVERVNGVVLSSSASSSLEFPQFQQAVEF